MSSRSPFFHRKKGKRAPSMESIEETREDDGSNSLPQSLRIATSSENLLRRLSLRRQRACSNLSTSSTSVDGRPTDSTTADIQRTRKQRTATERSNTSYGEEDESEVSDISIYLDPGHNTSSKAAFPQTTYSASSSRLSKDKGINHSTARRNNTSNQTSHRSVSTTLRKSDGTNHKMILYCIEESPADEMYDKVDRATETLDTMVVEFKGILKFLKPHITFIDHKSAEQNTLGGIFEVRATCECIKQALESLENEKRSASQASSSR